MRFVTVLWKNLLRRKARSLLTMFGVAVAVGTTVALLGLCDGLRRSTVNSFESHGVDVVVVARGVIDQLTSDLDESYRERIAALPGVQAVTAGLVEMVLYSGPYTDMSLVVQGWEPDSFQWNDLTIVAGRGLVIGDEKKAVLGVKLAKNIEKQVGDTLEIEGGVYEVVGIYQSFNVFENGAVTLPLAELQQRMDRENSVTGFSIKIDNPGDPDAVDAVCAQINALTDDDGEPAPLEALSTKEYANVAPHLRMAQSMAWITSIIAVLVGTIGVLNTMIMSVVERIREISILRAIGWRRSRVVQMIVGESLLLSLAGAILGAGLAVALIRWLTTLPAAAGFIEGRIAPAVIAQGFAMALVVGLIGGVWPAWRAARLLPSVGLRHE